jgi:hypothetical protein
LKELTTTFKASNPFLRHVQPFSKIFSFQGPQSQLSAPIFECLSAGTATGTELWASWDM